MGENPKYTPDERTTVPGVRLIGMQLLIFSALLHPRIVREVVPHILILAPLLWQKMMIVHNVGLIVSTLLIYKARALGRTAVARLIFVRMPWIGGLFLAIGTLLAWAALAEVFFWQIQRIAPPAEPARYVLHHIEGYFHRLDSLLGQRTVPCAKVTAWARIEPDVIPLYEVRYSSNEYGNRVVPQDTSAKIAHLATFGCSFMFGDGVNDDEALPGQLACLRPDIHVYSFAQSGYAPGQVALQVQTGVTDCIQESPGAAVYLFMSDHINRLLPRPKLMDTWAGDHPAFKLDAQGDAQYHGALRDVYSDQLNIYALWSKENFVRWSGLRFPLVTWQRDYDLAAAILDLARKEYQVRFPGNEFYILIDPVTHVNFDSQRLIKALDRRGLKVLDPEGLYGDDPGTFYHFELDRHPMPEAHALLAEWFWAQYPDGLLAGPRKVAE